jgi:hypothetical protein
MKKTLIVLAMLFLVTVSTFAEKGFEDRPNISNVSMPTGYTLHKGEFQVGIGPMAFGITDKVQVGTNILTFLLQIYNVNLKVNLIDTESNAFAAGLKFDTFTEESYYTSFSPFATFSTKIGPNTLLHLGGQYTFFSDLENEDVEDFIAFLSSRSTSLRMGLEYSFSRKTKFMAETGYDFSIDGFRLGGAVLWGWEKFRLKLGLNYFKPNDSHGFVLPVISLFWRFGG